MKPIANMKSNRRRSPFPSKKDNERTDNGGGSSSPGTSYGTSSFRIAPIPRADCSSNAHQISSKTSPTLLANLSTQSISTAEEDRSHICPTGSLGTPTGSSSVAAFADELNEDLIQVLFLSFFSAFLLLALK